MIELGQFTTQMEGEELHDQNIFYWKIVEKTDGSGRAEVVRPQTVQPRRRFLMPRLNHRGTVMGLAAVIALLVSITVAPTALAHDPQEQEFAMLDDFATEQTGASGNGVSSVRGDSVRIQVNTHGLLPHHQYEMKVTITTGRPPVVGPPPGVVTCGPETTNSSGHVHFDCTIDLVQLHGTGTHRLDFFVTHIHPTGDGFGELGSLVGAVLDRDPLLRCSPASIHFVPGDN